MTYQQKQNVEMDFSSFKLNVMNKYGFLFFCLILGVGQVFSQTDTTALEQPAWQLIVKTDGGELIGKVISQDPREVLIEMEDGRQIYVPQHMITSISPLSKKDFSQNGAFIGEDRFATRYFITTNGLPIRKGESYIQWNLYGPDFQFGLGNDVGVGFMTTWLGVPMIGTIKKSFSLGDNAHGAIGLLAGTGSWADLGAGGVLPFATVSFGDRRSNLALSGGYGAVWADSEGSGRALFSIAGMTKAGRKISLVFDSFISPNLGGNGPSGFALLIPGIRWHQAPGKAFQIGFTGVVTNGDVGAFGIPMVQWYRNL
ncbi:MAG: hypothetical protein R2787_06710 [Saprospiraceae bacterium]